MRKKNFACRISIDRNLLSYIDYSHLGCNAVFGIISPTFRRNVLRPSSGPKSKPSKKPARSRRQARLHGVTARRSLPNHCCENLKCSLQLLLSSFLFGFLIIIKFIFNILFLRFVYLCATDTWTMVYYVFAVSNFRYQRFHFIKFCWCLKHHITRLS
jgi:hypothetical protein